MVRATGSGKRIFAYIEARDVNAWRSSARSLEYYYPRFTLEQTESLAKYVVMKARRLAPKWSGRLWRSIDWSLVNNKRINIFATRAYAGYQEFGYEPHLVSAIKHPQLWEWAKSKGYPEKNYYFVSRYKPFMTPAWERSITNTNLKRFYDPALIKTIKRSFRKMRNKT